MEVPENRQSKHLEIDMAISRVKRAVDDLVFLNSEISRVDQSSPDDAVSKVEQQPTLQSILDGVPGDLDTLSEIITKITCDIRNKIF